ncbi:hypothetical protein Tco_0665050 [Tanacetum coccineum]
MPPADSYSALDVTTLNTRRTPIRKQPELLLCLRWTCLISAPNLAKVKTGTRPRAAHEVPLLTATANRVIDMDTTRGSGSSRTPSTMEKSLLDFADEDLPPPNTEGVRTEEQIQDDLSREIPPCRTCNDREGRTKNMSGGRSGHHGAPVNKRRKQIRRKRANDEAEANTLPRC